MMDMRLEYEPMFYDWHIVVEQGDLVVKSPPLYDRASLVAEAETLREAMANLVERYYCEPLGLAPRDWPKEISYPPPWGVR